MKFQQGEFVSYSKIAFQVTVGSAWFVAIVTDSCWCSAKKPRKPLPSNWAAFRDSGFQLYLTHWGFLDLSTKVSSMVHGVLSNSTIQWSSWFCLRFVTGNTSVPWGASSQEENSQKNQGIKHVCNYILARLVNVQPIYNLHR